MIGKIIFIRHGKTASLTDDQVDSFRALTSKGRKEIKKMMPALKDNIEDGLQLYLFSSFSLRSMQTAEIIAKEIGIKEISKYRWIENGNTDFFKNEIKQKQSPFCVIIVGHNPHLSKWSHHISGYYLPYKKGTMVGFAILSLEPLKAQPQWFLQPDGIDFKAIKIKNNKPVLHEFQKIMTCKLQEIFQMQKQFWLAPNDSLISNQLYIEISAFCALITFLKPLLNREKCLETLYQMQEFAIKFEYIKQLNMLTQEWTEYVSKNYECITLNNSILAQKIKEELNNEISKVYPEVIKKMVSVLFNLYIWIKNNFEEENLLHKDLQGELTFEEYTAQHFKEMYKKTKKIFHKNDFSNRDTTRNLKLQVRDLRDVWYGINAKTCIYMKNELTHIIALQDHLDLICNLQDQLKIIDEINLKYSGPILHNENIIFRKYLMDELNKQITEIKQYKLR